MSDIYISTRDVAAYKITDMEPFKIDEIVSGNGE
jgi:hypothetical protein